jgi:PERQ amino acid-rich with GYF domain-containing protein
MPVGSTLVENAVPQRYSREELLSIHNNMQQDSRVQPDVSSLFVSGWNPGHANGVSSRGWGKSGDSNVLPQEPDACWDTTGGTRAIGLREVSSEEKEVG